MLKLAYKVGSRGGVMVSTSARNAGDPWFESRSWYDRFLYVNIHLFIYIYIYISRLTQFKRIREYGCPSGLPGKLVYCLEDSLVSIWDP